MLRVLVCPVCQTYILAPEGPTHCVQNHGPLPVNFNKTAYCQAIVESGLHIDYNDVIHPRPRGPPVQFLTQSSGYACRINSECLYATTSKRMMENHLRDHGISRAQSRTHNIIETKVQSLFRSTKGRLWFDICTSLDGDRPDGSKDPMDVILQEMLPNFDPLARVSAPDTDRERTRFLTFMNWDTIVNPYLQHPHSLTHLKSLRSRPPSDDPLLNIHDVFMQYLNLGRDVVQGSGTQGFTVRKIILHGDNISLIATPGIDKYWTPLPDNNSPSAYCDIYADLLIVLWRCRSSSEDEYSIVLSQDQDTLLQRLVGSLSTVGDDTVRLLHSFVTSLLQAPPGPVEHSASDAIARYMALRALKEDNNFVGPEILSGWIAKFKYLCHNATAVEAFYSKGQHATRGIIG